MPFGALNMLENVSAQSSLSTHNERCEESCCYPIEYFVSQPRDCGWFFGDGLLALDAMMVVVHNGACRTFVCPNDDLYSAWSDGHQQHTA